MTPKPLVAIPLVVAAFCSVVLYSTFCSVPSVGHWLGWTLSALPWALALPFVVKTLKR